MNIIIKLITSVILITIPLSAISLDTKAKYAILLDIDTKEVLFEKNSHDKMAPSSMSKMMTAYVIFDYLSKGKIHLQDKFTHSENAWRKEGSRMFIPLGSQVTVEELLKGLIIQSGNDAAVSLAEAAAGTEEDFANVMKEYAIKLGLTDTNFINATGLPDNNHYTSANDLAIIAMRTIIDFPDYYKYYSQIDYLYNNIKQYNRNTLLYNYQGADGLKTGHTDEAGYGVTFSATKNGRRLVGVINGLESVKQRSIESAQLLNYGFMNFHNITIARKDRTIREIDIVYGKDTKVAGVSESDLVLTLPNTKGDNVKIKVDYNTPIVAPIAKGANIGKIIVTESDTNKQLIYPLVAARSVQKANLLQRMMQNIRYYLFG